MAVLCTSRRRFPILLLAIAPVFSVVLPVLAAPEGGAALGTDIVSRYIFLEADDTSRPLLPVSQRHESFVSKVPPLHKYFGYGAIILGATAVAAGSDDDLHHAAGVSAGILGMGAFATGILENRYYVDFRDGLSRYDTHALVGGLATAGFLTAVAIANSTEAHTGFGTTATIAVALTIPLLRW